MPWAPRRHATGVEEEDILVETAGRRLPKAKAKAMALVRDHGSEPLAKEARAQARGIKALAGIVDKLDPKPTSPRKGRPRWWSP